MRSKIVYVVEHLLCMCVCEQIDFATSKSISELKSIDGFVFIFFLSIKLFASPQLNCETSINRITWHQNYAMAERIGRIDGRWGGRGGGWTTKKDWEHWKQTLNNIILFIFISVLQLLKWWKEYGLKRRLCAFSSDISQNHKIPTTNKKRSRSILSE